MASDAGPNFTGHYELADTHADRVFAIDVQQTGDQATISFSASMNDGSGAAPDADGKGQIKGHILTFTFKDSFDNEGTGSLELSKGGYHLKLEATKVAEPRCLRFYGDLDLKKTSDKPQ
jgi:hypothetical protein